MCHSSRSRPHNFIWHCRLYRGKGLKNPTVLTTHPGTSQPLFKYGRFDRGARLQMHTCESCLLCTLDILKVWNETWKFGRSGRTKCPRVWRARCGDGAQETGIRHTVRRRSSAGDERVIMHHTTAVIRTRQSRLASRCQLRSAILDQPLGLQGQEDHTVRTR